MKAITIDQFGDVSELHSAEVPTPQPESNEVQIEIKFSGVNPVDWKIREGMLKNWIPHEFPLIPGWDGSGTIKSIGEGVTGVSTGDEVYFYCRKPTVQWGTYAEVFCCPADAMAPKPKKLNFAEAASIPLTALTAWQAFYDHASIEKGQTVFIHAGSGGVGSMAIQFAKAAGATVITTTSGKNSAYVKKLGADHVIDYTKQDFVAEVKKLCPEGVDIVLESIGGEVEEKSFSILRPGGHLASIVNNQVEHPSISCSFVFVTPNGTQLKEIGKLIDAGKVVAPSLEIIEMSDAAIAQEKSAAGHTQGKIVLKIE